MTPEQMEQLNDVQHGLETHKWYRLLKLLIPQLASLSDEEIESRYKPCLYPTRTSLSVRLTNTWYLGYTSSSSYGSSIPTPSTDSTSLPTPREVPPQTPAQSQQVQNGRNPTDFLDVSMCVDDMPFGFFNMNMSEPGMASPTLALPDNQENELSTADIPQLSASIPGDNTRLIDPGPPRARTVSAPTLSSRTESMVSASSRVHLQPDVQKLRKQNMVHILRINKVRSDLTEVEAVLRDAMAQCEVASESRRLVETGLNLLSDIQCKLDEFG
jgi:hypothetical protein